MRTNVTWKSLSPPMQDTLIKLIGGWICIKVGGPKEARLCMLVRDDRTRSEDLHTSTFHSMLRRGLLDRLPIPIGDPSPEAAYYEVSPLGRAVYQKSFRYGGKQQRASAGRTG